MHGVQDNAEQRDVNPREEAGVPTDIVVRPRHVSACTPWGLYFAFSYLTVSRDSDRLGTSRDTSLLMTDEIVAIHRAPGTVSERGISRSRL